MKLLQIACHKTNIGDGANITGFQKIFSEDAKDFGINVEYYNEEIMDYKLHYGSKDFNSNDFVDFANQFDLIIIGGGGFFSAFKRFSNSACHADFSFNTLDRIKTPIVYYAQGFSVYYGQKYYNTDRLGMLFSYVEKNNARLKVSFRNDGSKLRAKQFIDDNIIENIPEIPDGGFFVPVEEHHHPEIVQGKLNIGLQLAGDKSNFRFNENLTLGKRVLSKLLRKNWGMELISKQLRILEVISNVIEKLVRKEDANLIILPHIYSDLMITQRFTQLLPSDLRRFNTHVSAVLKGHCGARRQFDLYRKLDMVLGMRFHSNVCAYAVGTPSIGLVSHEQLDSMYQSLDSNSYVYLSSPKLKNELQEKIDFLLNNQTEEKAKREKTTQALRLKSKNFHHNILDWMA